MSVKTKAQERDLNSKTEFIKAVSILLFWMFFSIIAVSLIVKCFELYINRFGVNSFFYLLIFLFSICLIPVLYKKILNISSKDQKIALVKYFQDELRLGCLIESEDEDNVNRDYLDLDNLISKKNLIIDKKLRKEDREIWLKEERELFKIR